MSNFCGLPKELFTFLVDLSLNNNRDWFAKNKTRYLYNVVEPVMELIESVGEFLPKISKNFIADTRRNGGSMFRIYRDMRFTKEKEPYKTHVGCLFRHINGKDVHTPGFYIHIEPKNIFIGGGIWKPPNVVLGKIRESIFKNPNLWEKIISDKKFIDYFPSGIQGDSLKRAPLGFDKDFQFFNDLKKKSFFVGKSLTQADAQSPIFIKKIQDIFFASKCFIEFITKAVGEDF